ncbi:MAG: HDOD domain-containing protein [Zoogloeaceae bacterium]|nr:HDOD domain-containing protein [Zoogloeaceae bacterium]
MDRSIYLGRQPILDQKKALYGYELLFRNARIPNAANVTDDSAATATVISHAFSELSLGEALDDKKVFINIGEELLFSDVLEFLDPRQVVLEILETIPITPRVVERCKELKQKEFTLALDDICEIMPIHAALLPLVDIVKLILLEDWEEKARRIVSDLRGQPLMLLAERVETQEQFRRCAELGFSLFQGYFFAYPTVLQGRGVKHDRLVLMTLLNQILGDADIKELEETFKRAPALSVNLLRLTNSVAFGRRVQIISLRQAITLLGRLQLQRWLQLLLFSSPDNQQQISGNPLLQLAATRAFLMEKLARFLKPEAKALAEEAFMTGIMSFVPVILGMRIEEVLTQLNNLVPSIQEALLARHGLLGKLLGIVESLERDQPGPLLEYLGDFPTLGLDALNSIHCEAIAWAAELGRPMKHDKLPENPRLDWSE